MSFGTDSFDQRSTGQRVGDVLHAVFKFLKKSFEFVWNSPITGLAIMLDGVYTHDMWQFGLGVLFYTNNCIRRNQRLNGCPCREAEKER